MPVHVGSNYSWLLHFLLWSFGASQEAASAFGEVVLGQSEFITVKGVLFVLGGCLSAGSLSKLVNVVVRIEFWVWLVALPLVDPQFLAHCKLLHACRVSGDLPWRLVEARLDKQLV